MTSSKRFYLDYNSTSPLADSVRSYLVKGDFSFANPSSVHFSGKRAKAIIRNSSDSIQECFSTSLSIFYHSGATEGLNTLIKGHVLICPDTTIVYAGTDHSCIRNTVKYLAESGHKSLCLEYSENKPLDVDNISQKINELEGEKLLCWTWVNNETGIIQDLASALEIKKRTGCKVIVDAVQAPGKIEDWNVVIDELDAYVYSAHKFGSLKGSGFTLINENFKFSPLLHGGGQQRNIRSGTENPMAIESINLALSELKKNYNFNSQMKLRDQFEEMIESHFANQVRIVGKEMNRAGNTTCLLFRGERADRMLYLLDMHNIEISSGSACSAGTLRPSETLRSMGIDEEEVRGALRVSFPLIQSNDYSDQVLPVLISAFHKIVI